MQIRLADFGDIDAITAIYAHHVLNGTGTFELEPPSKDEIISRLKAVQEKGFPWIVAVDEADNICGYAYFAPFRTRAAYDFTIEDSIYIRSDVVGKGVGSALLQDLLERAGASGYRQMLAVIGDSDNLASINLHKKFGFEHCGTLKAVGLKFGKWCDVVMMQLSLGDGSKNIPATASGLQINK